MVSPGQSATARSPASISRNKVVAGSRSLSRVVLPMPDLPSISNFTPLRSAMRCCAEMIGRTSRHLLQLFRDRRIPEDLVAAVAVARVRHGFGQASPASVSSIRPGRLRN